MLLLSCRCCSAAAAQHAAEEGLELVDGQLRHLGLLGDHDQALSLLEVCGAALVLKQPTEQQTAAASSSRDSSKNNQ
jgi:hypothetical protein